MSEEREEPESPDDAEMVNMFASVWVKVEVEEQEDEEQPVSLSPPPIEVQPLPPPPAKKKRPKPNRQLSCDQCDYTTPYKNCLEIHMIGHTGQKPYTCNFCDFAAKFPSTLQRHISAKHREQVTDTRGTFICDICDYSTYCNWNLRAHKRKHKTEKKYKCELCSYATAYRNSYVKHTKTHMDKEMFKCDKCSFESKYNGLFQRHLAQMHNEVFKDRHACELCGFSNRERWKLKMHLMRSKKEKLMVCDFCEFQTHYRCELKFHRKCHLSNDDTVVKKVSVEVSMKSCDRCLFKARSEGQLQWHMLEAHNDNATLYKCGHCDFTTAENWRLSMHQEKGRSDEAIKCSHCEFTAHFKCELRKHKYFSHYSEIYGNGRSIDCSKLKDQIVEMINAQKKQELKGYEGESSPEDKKFNSFDIEMAKPLEMPYKDEDMQPEELEIPQTEHSKTNNYKMDPSCVDWHSIQVLNSDDKDRPFQCNFCDYTSKFKASVQRHFQRHHTGQKNRPFKCLNCDFSTKTKDQISLHNKRSQSDNLMKCDSCDFHTYFKCALVFHQKVHYTFKCSVCNYACRQKHELTKHFATYHLGIGLKCQYCDFTAIRKDSILCHETIHTGEKPYKCKMCDYSSVRKSLLDSHIRKHHIEPQSQQGLPIKVKSFAENSF